MLTTEEKRRLTEKRWQLTQVERRVEERDHLFKRIYEDNVGGKLSESRFQMLSDDYEQTVGKKEVSRLG